MRSPSLVLLPMLLMGGTSLNAQTLGDVEQRIDHLEQSVRQLAHQRTEADPYRDMIRNQSSGLLTLEARFAVLEKSLSRLVAAEEQDRRTIATVLDQIQRSKGDVEVRLEALEKPQSIATAPVSPAPVPVVVQQVAKPVTVDDRFHEALRFAEERDWVKAEFAFDTFINSFPEDIHVPEAKYWLARSYQEQGNPGQAARLFLELYEKYPKADFVLEDLFSLARALTDLGPENVVQACGVYSEIAAMFSDSLTVEQRQTLLDKRLSLKCEK